MTRPARPDAPTRPRRQARPALDRLEDRLQPNNLGGAWADLALGQSQGGRPRPTDVRKLPARHHEVARAHHGAPAPPHRPLMPAAGAVQARTRGTSPVTNPAAAVPPAVALAPAWMPSAPTVPSTAPVVAAPPPAARPATAPTTSSPAPMTATAGATPPAPRVTASSNFAADGGYTLSQWGANGSSAFSVAMWTAPGTGTQEIVTVGTVSGTSQYNNELGVARYRTDGTFDAGYGAGGVAANATGGSSSSGRDLALRPDGTVVAGGTVSIAAKNGGLVSNILTARFTPTGAVDTTFNGTGWAALGLTNSQCTGNAVGLQSTGKVVAAGTDSYAYTTKSGLVLRDTAAGKLDAGAVGFGQKGSSGTPVGYDILPASQYPNSEIYALAVQPDDKVVAVGRTYSNTLYQAQVTLSRLNSDGTPDPTFNGGNTVYFPQASLPWAEGFGVALQPDGKIVVAGRVADGSATGRNPAGLLVARFNPDGSLDSTFNDGAGWTRVDALTLGGTNAQPVAVDGAGRIVVGAAWTQTVNGATVYGVAALRLNPDGTPDATFGTNGIKSEAIPNTTGIYVNGVAVAADGSYYLAGSVYPTSGVSQTLLVHDLA